MSILPGPYLWLITQSHKIQVNSSTSKDVIELLMKQEVEGWHKSIAKVRTMGHQLPYCTYTIYYNAQHFIFCCENQKVLEWWLVPNRSVTNWNQCLEGITIKKYIKHFSTLVHHFIYWVVLWVKVAYCMKVWKNKYCTCMNIYTQI